jgi:hypothetical protein
VTPRVRGGDLAVADPQPVADAHAAEAAAGERDRHGAVPAGRDPDARLGARALHGDDDVALVGGAQTAEAQGHAGQSAPAV